MALLIKMSEESGFLTGLDERDVLRLRGRDVEQTARECRELRSWFRSIQSPRAKGDDWKAVMVIPEDIFFQAKLTNPDAFHGPDRDKDYAELWEAFPDCRLTEGDNPWKRRRRQ